MKEGQIMKRGNTFGFIATNFGVCKHNTGICGLDPNETEPPIGVTQPSNQTIVAISGHTPATPIKMKICKLKFTNFRTTLVV